MAFKKFLCILIVCSFFAAFGLQAAGAEADRVDVYPLISFGALTSPTRYVSVLDRVYDGFSSAPRLQNQQYVDSYTSVLPFGLTNCVDMPVPGSTGNIGVPFVEGYTYSFQWSFTYKIQTADFTVFPDFVPEYRFLKAPLSVASISAAIDPSTPDQSFEIDLAGGSSDTSESYVSASYTCIDVFFIYTFHCVNNDTDLDTLLWLISNSYVTSSTVNYGTVTFTLGSASAWEDPTGDIADDIISESDKIIQGQIDAANYAIQQEKAAAEAAAAAALAGVDSSVFDLSSFASSFQTLYNGLNYQGTDFQFMFPGSGVVPYVGLELWSQQEIPFKTWIDAIPPAIMAVVRFAAWFALAWAFISRIRALIQDINGGDD